MAREGLGRGFSPGFVVARASSGALIGCAGVERHGRDGLLRSARSPWRLRPAVRASAASWWPSAAAGPLYLLTTDAAGFFAALGFVAVAREAVSAAIQASEEFASICPRSASCMVVQP